MNGADCPRCQAVPQGWSGEKRRCAFATDHGDFTCNNYGCQAMGELRDIAEREGLVQHDADQKAALIPMGEGDGHFLVISWYKSRGRVDELKMLSDMGIEDADRFDVMRLLQRKGVP